MDSRVVSLCAKRDEQEYIALVDLAERILENYEGVKCGQVASIEGVTLFASMMGELKELLRTRGKK